MQRFLSITCLLLACCVGRALAAVVPAPTAADGTVVRLQLDAPAFAPERIMVAVYLPPGYDGAAAAHLRYPVLYANDGQDMPAVGLQPTLTQLYREHAIEPIIVIAIDMLADRASGYGLSNRATARSVIGGSQIGPIATRAQDYSAWVATKLVPYIDAHYRTRQSVRDRAMLGWSLGALNAFNLGWEYPEVFGRIGAFSPSFWLAADRSSATAIEHTRLVQGMVDHGPRRDALKMWFAVGTAEETSDRDGNGIIDAVNDVQDVIEGYRGADGFHARGLKQLGYSVNLDYAQHPSRQTDVALFLLQGGHHNQTAWGQMLPPFLRWAYGEH